VSGWVCLAPWGVRAVALVAVALFGAAAARLLRERGRAPVRRQAAALVLRAAALAIILFVALNPTVLVAEKEPGVPNLTLLVDTSHSMSVRDVDGRGRLEAALGVLGDPATLARLQEGFRLDVHAFDATCRPVDPSALAAGSATGDASDIASALGEAVSAQADRASQAGVLVISDGRATGPGAEDAARLALARSVPVWTWCLGGEVPRRDVWIEAPSREVLAFAGSEVELVADLCQTGYPNRAFRVEILRGGEVIDSRDVVPDEKGRARVRTSVKAPAGGEERFVFRAPPDPAEADPANNERAVFLRVVGDKVRVLLAEGRPHWDTKFLVQSLKRSEHVDLTAVYRLSPERVFAVVSKEGAEERREEKDLFPRSTEEMMRYDVVILGRGCEPFFEAGTEELLTRFVAERGGGLVLARGSPYEGHFRALAKFEPLAWGDGASPEAGILPTRAGRESPIFELSASDSVDDVLDRLPAPDRMRPTSGEKPLAVVLATSGQPGGEPAIAMAYQRYGQGKVLQLNVSGLWRWAFKERSEVDEDEHVYARFWNSILRWMLSGSDFLPGVNVTLRSERRYYTDEQKMRFLVLTRGIEEKTYRPALVVSPARLPVRKQTGAADKGGAEPVEVEPRSTGGGSYSAEAGPFSPGSYSVTLKSNVGSPPEQTMTVEVVSASVEKRVLSADPALMERLAETSGGKTLEADEVRDMAGVVERWRRERRTSVDKRAVWDRWYVLGALALALGTEWFLRRREGLL